MNRPLIGFGLALILSFTAWQVWQKERVLSEGTLILLRLAPVDPRSLMQGDYMVLRYAIAREVDPEWPDDGRVVLAVGEGGVADLVGRDEGQALEPGQALLRYRRRYQLRFGAESFFFEEGCGAVYAGARYGGLRVSAAGDPVLVGLYDAQRKRLEPEACVEPTPEGQLKPPRAPRPEG